MTLQQSNAGPHVAHNVMDFLHHQNIQVWNGRPCHQIWVQFNMSGMKWTVVCSIAVARLSRYGNWEKLSVRCGRTSHRPSWQTWWRLCDGDMFLVLKPGVYTLPIVRTPFWAPLSYDVINAYVRAPVSSKLVVCSTTKVITFVSKYHCVMSQIGKNGGYFTNVR